MLYSQTEGERKSWDCFKESIISAKGALAPKWAALAVHSLGVVWKHNGGGESFFGLGYVVI